ncbi:MAG: adenosylcobinamide-GDP ribazoletransferase [Muribaculaceae bacterium]|nr:adenosylcobinamide-GDP ribazoletransferase [Alistipes senegalensis]MCM1472667.1 adenosylcobinamide-GDP ribazoletransferase [Muribaculaceae bacterium]
MLKSMFSAFLMYSRIPVPSVEWKEENRRFSLCFFPIIGAVIGALYMAWRFVSLKFGLNELLTGAGAAVVPVLVTGGIHLDGFCDVSDAKASYGNTEKRLEIMKDSHIGAFAVINLIIYFILQTALFSQVQNWHTTGIIAVGFVLSRALSGLTAVTFRTAKKTGSLQDFTETAHKQITIIVLTIIVVICCGVMIFFDIFSGIICVISIIFMAMYYKKFSYGTFGGITGDLSGWFLQMCEITTLAGAVAGEVLEGVIK